VENIVMEKQKDFRIQMEEMEQELKKDFDEREKFILDNCAMEKNQLAEK